MRAARGPRRGSALVFRPTRCRDEGSVVAISISVRSGCCPARRSAATSSFRIVIWLYTGIILRYDTRTTPMTSATRCLALLARGRSNGPCAAGQFEAERRGGGRSPSARFLDTPIDWSAIPVRVRHGEVPGPQNGSGSPTRNCGFLRSMAPPPSDNRPPRDEQASRVLVALRVPESTWGGGGGGHPSSCRRIAAALSASCSATPYEEDAAEGDPCARSRCRRRDLSHRRMLLGSIPSTARVKRDPTGFDAEHLDS